MNKSLKIRNNKGVSLVALVITIIVMLILAGIIIINSAITQDKATTAKILNEFIEIENMVASQGKLYKLSPATYTLIGTPIEEMDQGTIINGILYEQGYYYLSYNDLVVLGINGATRDYIVNYETGEVIAVEPFLVNNKKIYTKLDLIYEETNNEVAGLAEYDEAKGVNKPILFNGMLPVKLVGDKWFVCSKNDKEWYDYSITSQGPVRYANAMLLDDTTLIDQRTGTELSNIEVRNKKVEDLAGYEVNVEGSMFIWIPRYSYKEDTGEIIYSKLTSDFLDQGFEKSPAFHLGSIFQSEGTEYQEAPGKEVTGIWISKYQAAYAN